MIKERIPKTKATCVENKHGNEPNLKTFEMG
jgi:hypothetical protein